MNQPSLSLVVPVLLVLAPAACTSNAGTRTATTANPAPTQAWSADTMPTPEPCADANADFSDVHVLIPTPRQLSHYRAVYRTEAARGFRRALDAGSLARDRFVVDSVDRVPVGGWFMRVQFRHDLDAIFQIVPCTAAQVRASNRIFGRFWHLPYDG